MLGVESVSFRDLKSPDTIQVYLCLLNAIFTGILQAKYDMLGFELVSFKNLKLPGTI